MLLYAFFFFYRFNEYGVDGGPAAKALKPKFDVFTSHFNSHTGLQFPEIEVRISLFSAVMTH